MAKILQIFVATAFTSLRPVTHNISATYSTYTIVLWRLNDTVVGSLLFEDKGLYVLMCLCVFVFIYMYVFIYLYVYLFIFWRIHLIKYVFSNDIINKVQKFSLNFHGWTCLTVGWTDADQKNRSHLVRLLEIAQKFMLNFYTFLSFFVYSCLFLSFT